MHIDSLESRICLAVTPVGPGEALPFQKFVINTNSGGQPLEKALGDIDGDGRMDAVIGEGNTQGGIYWYPLPVSGVISNGWTKHTIVGSGRAYEDMILKDVDNDGAVDVIASIANTVKWFRNPRGHGGNPRTDAWAATQIGNATAHDMVIADFDRDGKFDIATNVHIYFQNSPTSWLTVSGSNYARTGFGVGLIDIGDPIPAPRGELRLPSPFDSRPPNQEPLPNSIAIDLVGTGPTSSPYAIYWYENPIHTGGNPRTQQWVRRYVGPVYNPTYSPGGYTFDTMDVNGDGRKDIVTAQSEQPDDFAPPPAEGLAWWEAPANRRTGTWVRHQIDVNITQVHKKRIVDVNLDGRLDIVISEQEQSPSDHLALLYKQNGDNWKYQILATTSGHNTTVGDVDNDGDIDILNAAHAVYGGSPAIDLWVNGLKTPAAIEPRILKQPSSRTLDVGQSTTFVVATFGATPMSFQWKKNGVNISGATSSTYTLPSASASDNGAAFTVLVTNSKGNVTSDPAIVSLAPVTTVYMSDLNPTFATNGWGPYERDRSNGENGANDGNTIALNGVQYAKGLGTHAASELRYALGGQYSTFTADVGVDDEVGSAGSVVFQVWTDGTKIYDSATMTGSTATKQINLSVAGRNEIRLIVTDSGNGTTSDHGDWANARLNAASLLPGASPAPLAVALTSRRAGLSIFDDKIDAIDGLTL